MKTLTQNQFNKLDNNQAIDLISTGVLENAKNTAKLSDAIRFAIAKDIEIIGDVFLTLWNARRASIIESIATNNALDKAVAKAFFSSLSNFEESKLGHKEPVAYTFNGRSYTFPSYGSAKKFYNGINSARLGLSCLPAELKIVERIAEKNGLRVKMDKQGYIETVSLNNYKECLETIEKAVTVAEVKSAKPVHCTDAQFEVLRKAKEIRLTELNESQTDATGNVSQEQAEKDAAEILKAVDAKQAEKALDEKPVKASHTESALRTTTPEEVFAMYLKLTASQKAQFTKLVTNHDLLDSIEDDIEGDDDTQEIVEQITGTRY